MTAGHCFVKRTYDKCDGDCTFVEPRDIIAIKAGVRYTHTQHRHTHTHTHTHKSQTKDIIAIKARVY